jgi:dsRNA-specific ribonuclease
LKSRQLLQSALICTTFYAYLARKLGFKERIILGTTSAPETLESNRVLAGQFEAFVGGMFDEMGITRYAELFEWFRTLIEPYARSFEQVISTSLRNCGCKSSILECLSALTDNSCLYHTCVNSGNRTRRLLQVVTGF